MQSSCIFVRHFRFDSTKVLIYLTLEKSYVVLKLNIPYQKSVKNHIHWLFIAVSFVLVKKSDVDNRNDICNMMRMIERFFYLLKKTILKKKKNFYLLFTSYLNYKIMHIYTILKLFLAHDSAHQFSWCYNVFDVSIFLLI